MRRPLAAVTALAITLLFAPGSSTAIALPNSSSGATAAAQAPDSPPAEGSFTLEGAAAAAYDLPGDVQRVWTARYPDGATQTRYQQVIAGAEVLGGQVTVWRDGSTITSVIGAHFPSLAPTNARRLSLADSLQVAGDILGTAGERDSTLQIDPRDGRLYYEVETQRSATRPILWVDATTGNVTNRYDAIAEGEGEGVKGDRKEIDTTQQSGGAWQLLSGDNRQATYDAQNLTEHPGKMMTDQDNIWDLVLPGSPSPSQPAGVDAHYYGNLIDDFFGDTFGRNSIDNAGMQIISTVHYDAGYCNAFWNGEQMTYGDGDGTACKPLSGGLDVVGHELAHGVTEFTSGLIYENESGALNEAFSDMMGNTSEFYADQRGLDPAAQPDWLIGEDVIPAGVYGGSEAGFRDMSDPKADGDPDHYSERYTGTRDNGGVHTNSGIPNHAYYLAVNGGKNAGCGSSPSGHAHAPDCDVSVRALGLDRTAQIFYQGFTSMTEYANMCDARSATLAVAKGSKRSIDAAWAAVGVKAGCTPAIPPPPPCVGDDTAQIPFESPHPYGNNGDCTWTYDNGTAGFKFHFSMLETEAGYDYVYVKDAGGNVLARYDGTHPLPGGVTTPCIPTSVGSVQLTTDAAVIDQGLIVDAVQPC